jgi:dTMP kinase
MIISKKGKLIVIDGTDGSGKATQTNLIVEKLKKEGHDVEIADFPRYGKTSASLIEDYLNGKFGSAKEVGPYKASIFYAVDRYAASFQLKKWLEQGKIIICNRYVAANMGHQAGKIDNKKERDKFLDWLDNLEYNIFEIPKPNVNILLYMPPEIGQKLVDKKGHRDYINGNKRDIHEADLDHLRDAAESYKYVAKKYNWLIIDCAPNNKLKTIEEIHELIWEKIKMIL